jgi:hypothetical protein
VPLLVIGGNLKQSKLQSLSLLCRLLPFLIPHHNVQLVPWSWMMNRPALQCLLMMIQSDLLLQPTPFRLRLVVPVSALGQMRELVLAVHAEAKG